MQISDDTYQRAGANLVCGWSASYPTMPMLEVYRDTARLPDGLVSEVVCFRMEGTKFRAVIAPTSLNEVATGEADTEEIFRQYLDGWEAWLVERMR